MLSENASGIRRRNALASWLLWTALVGSSATSLRADETDSRRAPEQPPASMKSRGESFFAPATPAKQPAVKTARPFGGRVFLTKPASAPTPVAATTQPAATPSTTSSTTASQQTAATNPPPTTTSSAGATTATSPTPQSAAAQPTADYRGVPFVTTPAPLLKFERRSAPRLRGIDYDFAEQTAQGVALFSRFPTFTLSDRRIHVGGPWYNTDEANGHFTHAITSVEALPNYRQGTTDIRNISYTKKWHLMGDPLFWSDAATLANNLAASNPNDSRIAALRTLANSHTMTADQAAYIELGRNVWIWEAASVDNHGQGMMFPTNDIESTGGWSYERQCFGWLYQGMVAAAAEAGCTVVPITYGQYTYSVNTVADSSIDSGTGMPVFLSSSKDFVSTSDPTVQVCNDNAGVVSMDGYIQAIWGNEPFYKRTADGSLQLSGGQPVYNDITTTTCYGATITLESGEASHCLQDIYRQAVRMYLMYHWFAGQYPASSDLRKSFLSNARIGAWSRYTNEGLQGIHQNDRPIPGWMFEMLMGMYLFTADDVVIWQSEMNHPPGALGANYTSGWKYNAYGVVEYLLKAAHRYGALDPLHQGAFKWCWFHLPMAGQNTPDGERYYQKPIVFGKIRSYNGQPWLELFAAWPTLDKQSTELKLWIDKDGSRSPTYTIQLANGRSYFLDAWQLPAGMTGLEGKHVKLQFKDQLGVTRTWCGDYRVTP